MVFGIRLGRRINELADDRPLCAGAQVSVAQRDGRAVLMDLQSGRYFGLDEVATRIWELVLEGCTPVEIYAVLEAEYDAASYRTREDAARFLTSLLTMGLVSQ